MILPVWRGRVDAAYASRGVGFVRRVLLVNLSFGLVVGMVGALLTLLFHKLTAVDLAILVGWSEVIYGVEGLLAAGPIRDGLRPLEQWDRLRDEASARAAWVATADLPFRLLRRRLLYVVVTIGSVIWDLFGTWRMRLPTTSVLLILPGSMMVYLYWVALRFLGMEQVLRPVLADLGRALPDGGGLRNPRLTLRLRLLVAVPAITVIAGTVVAGIVGKRTVATLALGVVGGLVVSVVISSWLVMLLADSVARPITELRQAADRVGGGDLDVRVPVVSVDETGALAWSFNAMIDGLRERERLRDAFGTFVDPDLAARIARDGIDLGGEEVDLSVLFLDVRGFTAYAEQTSPRDVVASLNHLFDRVVPIIRGHGGHANKFVGDGLMAVFGAPVRLADHADRAAAAALELAGLCIDGLRVGVGVNSGSVLAGTVGGGGRLDFTVIGDAVNTAARVEAATRITGDDVLITGETLTRLTSGANRWAPRQSVALKGKHHEVTLYGPA
jgi:class 3 adenylate cyclase